MKMSDKIESFILELMKNEDNGEVELKRNELAEIFGCAPSQINYVIATRFTPEHGYATESRRGGGGYIRIRRNPYTGAAELAVSIGSELDANTASAITARLLSEGIINAQTASAITAAVKTPMPSDMRASVLKNILLAI